MNREGDLIERAIVNDAKWVIEDSPFEEPTRVLLSNGTGKVCALNEDLERLNRIP